MTLGVHADTSTLAMLESEDYSTHLGGALGHWQHSTHVISCVSISDRFTVFTISSWCTEKLIRSRYLYVQRPMASASGLGISPGVQNLSQQIDQ